MSILARTTNLCIFFCVCSQQPILMTYYIIFTYSFEIGQNIYNKELTKKTYLLLQGKIAYF